MDVPLPEAIVKSGGQSSSGVGSGDKSWIIQLLPQIAVQLVFYMGDIYIPNIS